MDSEKDKVPVEEQPETTVEIQPETTVKEQRKTSIREQPETIGENQRVASIKKQSETTVKETPEIQNQNSENVINLGERTTNVEVKDLKLEKRMMPEAKRVDDQMIPKEIANLETVVKSAIDNDAAKVKNVPSEIIPKKKTRRSKSRGSTFSVLSTSSRTLRREIRARKKKIRTSLLQNKASDEDSLFSEVSTGSTIVYEEARFSRLMALKESLLSDHMSFCLSELLLESPQSVSGYQIERHYSISNRTDFIDNFEDLPTLLSLSGETSEDEEVFSITRITQDEVEPPDRGTFVDPLSGEIVSSSTTKESLVVSVHEEGEDHSCEDDIDIDIISIPEAPIEVVEDEDADANKTFESFAALKQDSVEILTEAEEMILARQQRAMTYDFLYQLIDAVVEKGEITDQNEMLTRNLSKTKLFQRLVTQVTMLIQEKLLNNELVRKTIDYYKRIKNFRNITFIPLQIHETESLSYSNNLKRLDFLLKQENDRLIHSYIVTNIESSRNDELQIELEESENNLKNLILKTFDNSRLNIMMSRVENDLKVMAKKRAEISKARLALMQRQHIMATLQEKLAALEKISETLTLTTFISKQTEVLKLDKKIEERYFEFKKLKFTFTSELDKLAHIKEQTQFIDVKMKKQKRIFEDLSTIHLEKRDLLYKLKLEHSKILSNIREKSFQSGLLERPALLLDYDNTIDELSLQKDKVLQIQKNMIILQSKIEEIEKKLHNEIK